MTDPLDEERPRLGRRGRARYATTSADQRISRPLVIALVGVVAVAAVIFWPRGSGLRLDTADPIQVVRVDTTVTSPVPRSGDVDLTTARQPLVAEPQSRQRTTDRDLPLTITSPIESSPGESSPAESKPIASNPVESSPTEIAPAETTSSLPPAEPAPIPQPTPEGVYALQVSSFASESGALTLRDDLQDRGYPVHVRAASTATGAIVYRVWVGYFRSREAAAAYAAAHSQALSGATPVHR